MEGGLLLHSVIGECAAVSGYIIFINLYQTLPHAQEDEDKKSILRTRSQTNSPVATFLK